MLPPIYPLLGTLLVGSPPLTDASSCRSQPVSYTPTLDRTSKMRCQTCLFACVFLSLVVAPANSLYFLVTQGVKRCFLEEVPAHTVVVGVYQNPEIDTDGTLDKYGKPMGITITVLQDSSKVILQENAGVDGRFAFTSEEEGVFEICMEVNQTTGWFGEPKKFKFHLDIQVGESSIDYTALAKKEHLSDVEIRVRKLSDRITAITNEMHYQRKREEEFRNTSESTNTRVMWWSIFQTSIMLLSTLWQIKHLKTFFEEKKLV
eukprot:g14359.t1